MDMGTSVIVRLKTKQKKPKKPSSRQGIKNTRTPFDVDFGIGNVIVLIPTKGWFLCSWMFSQHRWY